MTKIVNPMKVITGPKTRWSYANVWEAKSINGGAPKFSVSLIVPKSDTATVAKIQAAIEAAYKEGESKLAEPYLLFQSSRLLCVTVTLKDRMIRLMPMPTSSMPTAPLLREL